MWKLGNRHLIGKSHVESGIENQDKCFVFEKDNAAIFIVSDGAGSARYGAVTHPGAKKEKKIYSDI